ncbi:Sodium/hydrogen exchanger family [Musa troglodytarum]|uniref:Sodium/hydrogen exchanger family n=1 Tax=Musa troglodytarum TaxID=320322 RepID=A0A9E7FIE4_9LILI|nr:Sodium/hydrogen exchanger family [Musa troglodytarum]
MITSSRLGIVWHVGRHPSGTVGDRAKPGFPANSFPGACHLPRRLPFAHQPHLLRLHHRREDGPQPSSEAREARRRHRRRWLRASLRSQCMHLLRPQAGLPDDLGEGSLIFFVASRLSLSSFPVIAYTLDELRLLNSDLGRVVLSASLFSDVINWGVASLTSAYTMITAVKTPGTAIGIVASLAGSLLFVLLVARPTLMWSVRRTPAGETLVEWHFLVLLMTALLMSLATQAFGYNVTLGPLMLGLAIPGGMPVGQTIKEKLEPLGGAVLAHVYSARRVPDEIRGGEEHEGVGSTGDGGGHLLRQEAGGLGGHVTLLRHVGERCHLGGAHAQHQGSSRSLPSTRTLGAIDSFDGALLRADRVHDGDHGGHHAVDQAVVQTYDALRGAEAPHGRARKAAVPTALHGLRPQRGARRTLLDLLEASYACRDSPIALTVLHLTELAGQSAAVLRPHKHSRRSANPTASDRIVNAFTYFEKQQAQPGSISVHPFVAMAPYSTLYNDVCSLALDRKVCFILLPFHKCCDGAQETVNHAFQTLNRNVLAFAPCSVAILVDRSLPAATCAHTNHLLHLVAVYFLGGPDDREALAFASRMANNRSITVTVIRLLPHVANDDKERKLDDAAVERLRESHAHNQRLVYMEKVVEDGEGTAAVIQEMSDQFDLLIVGRRKGVDSAPTRGCRSGASARVGDHRRHACSGGVHGEGLHIGGAAADAVRWQAWRWWC